MKLADLPLETRRRISALRFDRIVEKHQGPWNWRYRREDDRVEILAVDGYDLLLPVEKAQHANISIKRLIMSADRQTLTVFLTDTTYETGKFAGFLAICERVPGEERYIASVYHEGFVVEDVATQYRSAAG